jgi:glycosyltransferase involved in cell wall biosynthesis
MPKRNRISVQAVSALETFVLRRATLTLAVTESLTERANQLGAHVVCVPTGVDTDVYSPAGDTWLDPWHGRLPYFVYAGNFGVIHGASIFADAAELLLEQGERFGMLFMGYGVDAEKIERVASRWPHFVKVLPPEPSHLAAAALRSCRAALASVRPLDVTSDSRPIKALSALACGTPVVFAGSGEFARTLKEEELGWVADWEARDVAASLREALLAGSVDEEQRAAIAMRAANVLGLMGNSGVVVRRLAELARKTGGMTDV